MPAPRPAPGTRKPRAPDPLVARVGERVRLAREALDLSLAQAAERVGLSKDFLWRLEVGRQAVTVRSLAQVARGLDTSMSALLDGIALGPVGDPADRAPAADTERANAASPRR